ncbi:hypothetical protein [Luteipulveratus mongoliensis]|uniref:Uncharacterized protein n=1 Tax=Luteipulveratus mongoliensis TaxID=571913 RepID=A0A0K1JEI6_9MICO|nr:hypothetical protein [Luteipulveratus mongoliensis]AKU15008.1 hypothetical protein VV02_02580 [Luteipulveratus mongoliensis]
MKHTFATVAAVAGLVLAGTVATAPSASAQKIPVGCASPQLINSAPIMYGVGSQTWRIGTITQYWGWCNSAKRNWAHVHLYQGNEAFGLQIAIQTRDWVMHGLKTVNDGRDFTSRPTDTLSVDTRARVSGNFWNGGLATLTPVQVTPWT